MDSNYCSHRAENSERREVHHVARYFEHDVRNGIEELNDNFSFFTNSIHRCSEEDDKNNDLQNFIVCHCIDDIRRENMQHKLRDIERSGSSNFPGDRMNMQ